MSMFRKADASEVDLMILCFALLGFGFAKLCSLQSLIKFINCQHYSQDINKFTYLLLLVCSINQLISKLLSVFERVFVL